MLYYLIDLLSGAIVPLAAVLIIFGIVKKAGAKKTILIALFTLYLAEMFDIVGVPYAQVLKWNPILNPVPFSDLFKEGFSFWAVFQFAANIALFVPFGVLLPAIWKSFRRLSQTAISGALLSICIELSQLFSHRVTALDDLLMNTLGALLGYLLIAAFSKKRWKKDAPEAGIGGRDRAELLVVTGLSLVSVILFKYAISSYVYGLPMVNG